MRSLSLLDLPFLAPPPVPADTRPCEDFQGYADGGSTVALNKGFGWTGASVIFAHRVLAFDDFQSFGDGGDVTAGNSGSGWGAAAVIVAH